MALKGITIKLKYYRGNTRIRLIFVLPPCVYCAAACFFVSILNERKRFVTAISDASTNTIL